MNSPGPEWARIRPYLGVECVRDYPLTFGQTCERKTRPAVYVVYMYCANVPSNYRPPLPLTRPLKVVIRFILPQVLLLVKPVAVVLALTGLSNSVAAIMTSSHDPAYSC